MECSFKVVWDKRAEKDFKKIGPSDQRRILSWLHKNISGSGNPRILGATLSGDFEDLWRYRVGKYRIVADIQDEVFTVLVVKVGKRSEVYRKRG